MADLQTDGAGNACFSYQSGYVSRENAFSLDPSYLPLSTVKVPLAFKADSGYGVLSDPGPGAWGRRVIEAASHRLGVDSPQTPIDWLIRGAMSGSGCLGFSDDSLALPVMHPPLPSSASWEHGVMAAIDRFAVDGDESPLAGSVLIPGAGLGGARPKSLVIHDNAEHIVKFGRRDDQVDVPAVEYATLRLAHLAKIDVPDFELIQRDNHSCLLLRRFDRREDGTRMHTMSACSLLDADTLSPDGWEYVDFYSYAGIAKALLSLNPHAMPDVHQLFRRMVFNIFIGNVDDHLRNHALIQAPGARFQLSPAFDLLPHLEAPSLPQSIGVGNLGRASTISNALSQHARFSLSRGNAIAIVDEVHSKVMSWRNVFAESGVTDRDIRMLQPCFVQAELTGMSSWSG